MKIPTAKAILYTYRKKGRIYSKKNDKTIPQETVEQNTPELKEENIE